MDSGVDLTVRKASSADAELLASMGERLFSDAYGSMNDPDDMAAYLRGAFAPEIQARELGQPGSVFFIAEESGEAVGYARILSGGSAPTCITGSRPIELVRMYSAQSHIGKGIGGRLITACIEEGRVGGYDVMWLSVWQKNPRAIAFYQKWGFEIAGAATFTIGSDIQTDWIMGRRL